jgi:hypothetical protein
VAETSKLKRERRAVHIGRREKHTGSRCGKLKERHDLQELEVDGTIMLKEIFKKSDRRCGLDLSGSGYGQVVGSCECGNEPPGSIKWREFD